MTSPCRSFGKHGHYLKFSGQVAFSRALLSTIPILGIAAFGSWLEED
jgi:hypothetical protein